MFNGRVHVIIAISLFIVVVGSYLVMAVKFPVAYMVATYEDLVGEWTQVLLFFSVMLLALRVAFFTSRYRLFFILLAIAGFYTFMEEISWGQRLFDIPTPDFFKKHNLQQETNLHNFFTGPFSTQLKGILEYGLCIGLLLYGLVYPLLLGCKWKVAVWVDSKGIPAPPLYLWPFFVMSGVLELGLLGFNEAEVAEILIPLGLVIFLLHYWILYRDKVSVQYESTLNTADSKWLAVRIGTLFIGTVLLSSAITYASYSSPEKKAKIDSRLNNGIEKFAGRYKRYGQWDKAIGLYHLMDEKEPNRPSIQRKLAHCYSEIGNKKQAGFYIDKAFQINQQRLAKKPGSISANISQAITYRQIQDVKNAEIHSRKALENALQRVKKNPESASAAYWLGNTYKHMGEYSVALVQYKRALELKPHRKKYIKAALKMELRLRKFDGKHDGEGAGE